VQQVVAATAAAQNRVNARQDHARTEFTRHADSAAEAECDTVTDHEQRFDISASDVRRRRESVDTASRMVNRMTDERRFEELLSEFTRVGVDLDSFPAGIGVHREDALRILRSLPDGAGPAAFLSRVRQEQHSAARSGDGDAFSAAGD
jgi:hypothetical protein